MKGKRVVTQFVTLPPVLLLSSAPWRVSTQKAVKRVGRRPRRESRGQGDVDDAAKVAELWAAAARAPTRKGAITSTLKKLSGSSHAVRTY